MTTLTSKAKNIKLVLLDVDGVLTNGIIYYGENGIRMRGFHVRDGMGIRLIQEAGLQVGIISAKSSASVRERLEELRIKHIFLGEEDKLSCYDTIKTKCDLKDTEIAYMGDDILDLPLIYRAGLTATTNDAPDYLKSKVDMVTRKKSGKGAVREFCDFILTSQDKLEDIIHSRLLSVDRV